MDSSQELLLNPADSGLEVIDLETSAEFAARRLHVRDVSKPIEGVHRLARAVVENPETILQELVNAAVDLCGADSAGLSIERPDGNDAHYYEWIATAGEYKKFMRALLPRVPSACGVCLLRGRPQLFRISQRFYDTMGVRAAEVTDGILLPWHADTLHGTLWIIAHGRTEAFDQDDCRILQIIASMAAMGVAQQRRYSSLTNGKAAPPTNPLFKRFGNSLLGLRSALFVAKWSQTSPQARRAAAEMNSRLRELEMLVDQLLEMPVASSRLN